MSVRPEEPKVEDPSIDREPDLRLTIKEWVIYWKTRHDQVLTKVVEACRIIDKLKADNKALHDRIEILQPPQRVSKKK